MSEPTTIVGKRLPRVDGIEKATGAAKYTADIRLPGMLHAKIKRSPHAHARIVSIDTSQAARLPGVKAILTADDVPHVLHAGQPEPRAGSLVRDQYILADKVRFFGDGVAAVAAVSEDVAEEALELIAVEYEVLPAVFDPEEAMLPGAPSIHGTERNLVIPPVIIESGDVAAGFAEADFIFEDRYVTSRHVPAFMEPYVCVCRPESGGKLTVWSSDPGAVHGARHPQRGARHPDEPDSGHHRAHGRRLRRQTGSLPGRVSVRPACHPDGAPGQAGVHPRGNVRGRPLAAPGDRRAEAGRQAGRHPDRPPGALHRQLRRLRLARAGDHLGRLGGARLAAQVSERPHRRVVRLHQRPHRRRLSGLRRAAGLLRAGSADGRHRRGARHGSHRAAPEERVRARRSRHGRDPVSELRAGGLLDEGGRADRLGEAQSHREPAWNGEARARRGDGAPLRHRVSRDARRRPTPSW